MQMLFILGGRKDFGATECYIELFFISENHVTENVLNEVKALGFIWKVQFYLSSCRLHKRV